MATEAFFATRSMRTLEILAFGPRTASQIALELQVHPRTARRLLNRMVTDGWAVRREGRRPTYVPSLRVVALAAQYADRTPLSRHGTALVRELHEQVDADVHLVLPSYRSTMRLVCAGVSGVVATRNLAPAHATAGGKLLLAYRSGWRRVVLNAALPAVAANTVVDRATLEAELETSARRGYAVEDEEFRAGVRAVATPVRMEEDVLAALTISSARHTLAALVERRLDAASAATELIGRLQRDAA